jgi:hypothetical protein
MRTAWLLSLLFISVPACSDDGSDDDAGGAGSNAGGTTGGRGGVAGTAGRSGGAAGSAGSASAGSSGAAGSAGSASAGSSGAAGSDGSGGGAAGASGSSASGASDCERLCSSRAVCPSAQCLSSCEDASELCPDELEALLECGEPLSDDEFQCVGGLPIPGDDFCVTESAALARCRIGF